MWQALEHHDRDRFELFFYSLSAERDEWTERYRGLADRFEVIAELSDARGRDAASPRTTSTCWSICATHTKGAKPGILALQARARADHARRERGQSSGCPRSTSSSPTASPTCPRTRRSRSKRCCRWTAASIRTVTSRRQHASVPPRRARHRARRRWSSARSSIRSSCRGAASRSGATCSAHPAGEARVFAARSRRCAQLYLPRAAACRHRRRPRRSFVPQGRDDAENQARYALVDFVLDPMPYGGVNGTMEALDMGVPVVTLCGRCATASARVLDPHQSRRHARRSRSGRDIRRRSPCGSRPMRRFAPAWSRAFARASPRRR